MNVRYHLESRAVREEYIFLIVIEYIRRDVRRFEKRYPALAFKSESGINISGTD